MKAEEKLILGGLKLVRLNAKERLRLLHENHKEHIAVVMKNYAQQVHELLEIIEVEEMQKNG